jgi:hypothetical protein
MNELKPEQVLSAVDALARSPRPFSSENPR